MAHDDKKKKRPKKGKRKAKQPHSAMYADAKTWNPFKGCAFDCTYCDPTFKRQAKRQKKLCGNCYDYRPHWHQSRLKSIPSSEIVFVAGNADISFCKPENTRKIIARIKEHDNKARIAKTYYFQSKRPQYFEQFLTEFPENVILLMTLETNRDEGYSAVSKAPSPSVRYEQFKALNYPRKVITIEPILDFDLRPFLKMITQLNPEYVWIGFNSHPSSVPLPDPSELKVAKLITGLRDAGIPVKGKDLRAIDLDAS